MGLNEYRRKRNLAKSGEPKANQPVSGKVWGFVVQKHDATNVHFDLRLRVGDAMKSWAVPKGPSLDPREKRLAIEVEDHPLAYASFEGVIPEGYGAGTVMIWDRGDWSPETDAADSLRKGLLKFRLEGERLKGRWMLARTKTGERQPHWILVKERDTYARASVSAETFATSVASGRSMEEIAQGKPAKELPKVKSEVVPSEISGAIRAPKPAKLKPQLAEPATQAPDGPEWLHEVKLDGYRLHIHLKGEEVRVLTRSGLDWSTKFQSLSKEARAQCKVDAILDGEAVVLDTRGISDFQALQNAIHSRRERSIVFFAFDLPWCDGFDLTRCSLQDRRALLRTLIGVAQDGRIRFSEHLVGHGAAALEHACAHRLEGIVSKKGTSPYVQARSDAWRKIKCFNQQDFVVGGFTKPEGVREEFGALLLGYNEKAGRFMYAGKVGTGFSNETLRDLARRLRQRKRSAPAFANPPAGREAKGVTWTDPVLVVQVQFRDWTSDGHVRHTSFRGLREDLDARAISREPSTQSPPKAPRQRAIAKKRAKGDASSPPSSSTIRLTNPDRVVFPDRGAGFTLTKRQVADYYEAISHAMLPHIANRPLAILRCPSGEGGPSFFQKHPAKGMPAAVKSVKVSDEGGEERHLMIDDVEGLMGLVQMNAIEFHPWQCVASDIEHPDRWIFDLDPGDGVSWKTLCKAASMVREALSQLKMPTHVRTTGGKGLHVVAPLQQTLAWEESKAQCKAIAETLARLAPRLFVVSSRKQDRHGRIYIDYLRNARGATAIAPYSLRARPGAPVATPVEWEELDSITTPAAFNAVSVPMRVLALHH